jgi:asparagine synthase (glutamine-hydrolysing)
VERFSELQVETMYDKIPLNTRSINAILTLRYNPFQTPIIPKLGHGNFLTTNHELSIDYVENIIISTIKKTISEKNKKITIALSGGVDSTLLAAILKKNFPEADIEALSIKFAESVDETPIASSIAEYLDIKHRIVDLENYLIELPKAISIIKVPHWDLHWYHVVKNMSQNSEYLLSGDGGDELFGGYVFRYKKYLSLVNSKSLPTEKIKAYLSCHERDWVPDQEALFSKKSQFSWDVIYDKLMPYFDNSLDLLNQVFLADFNGKLLFNWLPIYSKLYEHFNVKPITPLLSEDLIRYCTHAPIETKYDQSTNIGKLLLRKLLSKYQVDNFVPKEKLGFSASTINLWKFFGKKLCQNYLKDARITAAGYINQSWLDKWLVKNDDIQVRYVNKFMGLLAFEIWYRLFVTKDMSANTTLN